MSYSWPGNVRELNSVLMQACFLSDGGEIQPEHLSLEDFSTVAVEMDMPKVPSLKDAEIVAIRRALIASEGNMSKAADFLQISRNTLYRKIEGYNIQV